MHLWTYYNWNNTNGEALEEYSLVIVWLEQIAENQFSLRDVFGICEQSKEVFGFPHIYWKSLTRGSYSFERKQL